MASVLREKAKIAVLILKMHRTLERNLLYLQVRVPGGGVRSCRMVGNRRGAAGRGLQLWRRQLMLGGRQLVLAVGGQLLEDARGLWNAGAAGAA
jgi:hypothetical protein